MLRQQAKLITRVNKLVDFTLLFVALYLAFLLKNVSDGLTRDFNEYAWLLFIAIPTWFYLLEKHGLYASFRRLNSFNIAIRMVYVHAIGGFVCAAAIFLLHFVDFSRYIYGCFLLLAFLFLTIERIISRKVLGYLRAKGYNTRNILLVGLQNNATRVAQLIEDHKDWGLRIVGAMQVDVCRGLEKNLLGYPVLGYITELVDICKRVQIDEVVFCPPRDQSVDIDEYLLDLEELGITVRLVFDVFESNRSHRTFGILHDEIPILTFHTKCLDAQQLFLKRILDIGGALVGLLVTTLLLPFITLAIWRDDPGPIFFGQDRVGENGRIFRCWKFRSMYIDAEERKKELMAQNEMKGAIFKIKNDPRVIPVGHFLRKTSLDELPQFWNVLKGEMSLVGTRPPTPAEVSQYKNWHRRRISIKPGITGLWQVSGRNQITDFDEIVRLDLRYIDHWCLWSDIRILIRTIKVSIDDGTWSELSEFVAKRL